VILDLLLFGPPLALIGVVLVWLARA